MKILFISNVGNYSGIMIKKLSHQGIESQCAQNYPRFYYEYDHPNIHRIYGNGQESVKEYYNYIQTEGSKSDIIHVFYDDYSIPIIKKLLPNKKIILTYCGSDIRGRWSEKSKQMLYNMADLITVKTSDLMNNSPRSCILTPIAIDCEHFTRTREYDKGTAIHITREDNNVVNNYVKSHCEQTKLELMYLNRNKDKPIDILGFPYFLQQFEWFIDVKTKNDVEIHDVSGTALQQLALGGKVWHWGKTLTKLPNENDANVIAKRLVKIYEKVLS